MITVPVCSITSTVRNTCINPNTIRYYSLLHMHLVFDLTSCIFSIHIVHCVIVTLYEILLLICTLLLNVYGMSDIMYLLFFIWHYFLKYYKIFKVSTNQTVLVIPLFHLFLTISATYFNYRQPYFLKISTIHYCIHYCYSWLYEI